MPLHTENGFNKADSRNLPKISGIMVAKFYLSDVFRGPEMRHRKLLRSTRASYGDSAVGFVQISRTNQICHIKACVTPEHRVTSKNYNVHCILDSAESLILKAACESCPACEGGCKHAVALVTWLHRRSEEPPCTSVTCYWKRSTLSKVGSDVKSISQQEIKAAARVEIAATSKSAFIQSYVSKLNARDSVSLLRLQNDFSPSLSIHHLLHSFLLTPGPHEGENFLNYCSSVMDEKECKLLTKETAEQAKSKLWFKMRYARVTASKLFDVSRCQTADGSLVNQLLGARKIKDTKAMERGRKLEPEILKKLGRIYGRKVLKVGLILRKEHGIFGASPDGLLGDAIVEVKCPATPESFVTYFSKDTKKPANKYLCQMLLQMHMSDKKKGIYCVAEPDFEKTGALKILHVPYDETLIKEVMQDATKVWITFVFPKLLVMSPSDSS